MGAVESDRRMMQLWIPAGSIEVGDDVADQLGGHALFFGCALEEPACTLGLAVTPRGGRSAATRRRSA